VSGPKVLVTGGARSGKSGYAQALAESLSDRRTYVATAEARGPEMVARIRRHQAERGAGWTTVEEPIAVGPLLDRPGVVLLDCLTLWLSNVLEARGEGDLEDDVAALVAAVAAAPGPLVLVTNEVGAGIVPANALARRFRDEAGRLAQRIGGVCDRVVLVVAGGALDLPRQGSLRAIPASSRPRRARGGPEATMTLLSRFRASMPDPDLAAAAAAQEAVDGKTKPRGSLGRLEALAVSVARITALPRPPGRTKAIVVMGADHGVAARGVSAYPQEVTHQMLLNFARGGAAINALAAQAGARVVVVDAGVVEPVRADGIVDGRIGPGTADFTRGPAMSTGDALRALAMGAGVADELIDDGVNIIGLGEMGIGNTTSASALTAALLDRPADEVTGRGTGIDDDARRAKVAVIEEALARHAGGDTLELIAALGGFEILGLAGVALGAAARRVPVVVDGFISTAAALCAVKLVPASAYALVGSHCSVEPGHRALLAALDLDPLLDLDLRLGEGTGAALVMPLVDGALRVLHDMASFADAGVSDTGA